MMLILGLIQVFLIVFYAPNIFLFAIIERVYPDFFKIKYIEKSGVYFAMHAVLKKNFWSILKRDIQQKSLIMLGELRYAGTKH